METHRGTPHTAARDTQRAAGFDVPVLDPRPGGPASRVASSLGSLHPVAVFFLAMFAGLALIAALSIGVGFFVTHVVEQSFGIGGADERVNVWLAGHRTSSRTDASLLGSILAGGVVLPIVAAAFALVCAVLRKWRLAAFFAFGLAVESATYRATTLVIHSHRPHVARLEQLPVNASYPSGHTAASIAVYGGLVLLLTSRFRIGSVRAIAWTLAVAVVTYVATARMYRGMHHSLDVAGGIVVGISALTVIVFACRTSGAAAQLRDGTRASARGAA